MPLINDAQVLADRYCTAIKRIRLIGKNGKDLGIIAPSPTAQFSDVYIATFQGDFDRFTNVHRAELQEVRVILKAGGASQFFPRGTPQSVVWASIVSKEEMEA